MKNLPRISALLYHTPWQIVPSEHRNLSDLFQSYLAGELSPQNTVIEAGSQEGKHLGVTIDTESGIAVLPIYGVIGKKLSWFDMVCMGGCDLVYVDRAIEELKNRDDVRTVILDIDTPGGVAIGINETAQRIVELGESKRVVAYTDYYAASCGYRLAAAAHEFYASPSAMIGSVGTFIAGVDSSKAWTEKGKELKLFRLGEYKALGLAGKKWTDEECEHLQESVNMHGEQFRQFIRDHRPGVTDEEMQGQVFDASDASPAMVDGLIRDLDTLIAAEMS